MIARIIEAEWRVWPQLLMTTVVIGIAVALAYA